jgi:hypothetical protein
MAAIMKVFKAKTIVLKRLESIRLNAHKLIGKNRVACFHVTQIKIREYIG